MYEDYRLRILTEKRQLAYDIKRNLSLKLSTARDKTREVRRVLDSRRRVCKLVAGAKSDADRIKHQAILDKYPPENQLVSELEKASENKEVLQQAFDEAKVAYEDARDRAAEQKRLKTWIRQQFGHFITRELIARFGKIELECRYNDKLERLDVYFGGKGFPLGARHAHWIFDQSGLVYRRDPGKK